MSAIKGHGWHYMWTVRGGVANKVIFKRVQSEEPIEGKCVITTHEIKGEKKFQSIGRVVVVV